MTFGQQIHVRRLLAAKPVNDAAFNAFEANGLQLQNFGHVVRGNESIIKAQSHQRAMRRIVDQPDLRFKNDNACSFRAHQGPGHVEAALGKKFIQVVPGDAPWESADSRRGCVRRCDREWISASGRSLHAVRRRR